MRDSAVLLVDDRDENLLALQAVLEPSGCRLVSATLTATGIGVPATPDRRRSTS